MQVVGEKTAIRIPVAGEQDNFVCGMPIIWPWCACLFEGWKVWQSSQRAFMHFSPSLPVEHALVDVTASMTAASDCCFASEMHQDAALDTGFARISSFIAGDIFSSLPLQVLVMTSWACLHDLKCRPPLPF